MTINNYKILIGIVLVGVLGYSSAEGIASAYYSHQQWLEGNKRGYIRCVDGNFEMGNFDVEGDFDEAPIQISANTCRSVTDTIEKIK